MNKQTMRSLIFFIFCTMFSPAVRLFSVFSESGAAQEAVPAPLAAGILSILFFLAVLRPMLRGERNYYASMRFGFGKPVSGVMTVLYLLWGTCLFVLQLRYCSLRIASAAYAHIPANVFSFVMILLCAYALFCGRGTAGRIAEIVLPVIFLLTVVLLALLSRDTDAERLLSQGNLLGTARATLFVLASFGYLTFLTFFHDETTARERFSSRTIAFIALASLTSVWLFASVIGSLGTVLTQKLPLPFFSAVQQIEVGEFVQHIDAFVVTIWVLSDFLLLCLLASSVLKLLEDLTEKRGWREWSVPYLLFCFALLPLAGQSERDAAMLSARVFMPANLFFLFLVPAAVRIACAVKTKKEQRSGRKKTG